MTTSMHKTIAALRLPTSVPELLSVADAIVLSMTHNPAFAAPVPPLPRVVAAIEALREAEVVALARTRGAAAARNEKRAALVSLLLRLKAYVQGVADEDPARAQALVESAGMTIKRTGAFAKPEFAVKAGPVSGSVELVVRSAGDRTSYDWAWSDDGGASWRSLPSTLQARTSIRGIPAETLCAFRFRVVTKDGEGDWSAAVTARVR